MNYGPDYKLRIQHIYRVNYQKKKDFYTKLYLTFLYVESSLSKITYYARKYREREIRYKFEL